MISHIGCIVIWSLSLLLPAITFIISLPYFYDPHLYNVFHILDAQVLMTAPILLTLAMYGTLLCTLNQQTTANSTNAETSNQMKGLAKMTHGIVIGLVVCNVPGLAFMIYLGTVAQQGKMEAFFKSNIAVWINIQKSTFNCTFCSHNEVTRHKIPRYLAIYVFG